MTMRKTFEVEKNGYRMFMVEDSESNYKSLEIRKENDELPSLYLPTISQLQAILKHNSFEELEVRIGTVSISSQTVEGIKEHIKHYELAIETVEYLKAELIKNFSNWYLLSSKYNAMIELRDKETEKERE